MEKLMVAYADNSGKILEKEEVEFDQNEKTLVVTVGTEERPPSTQDINKVQKIMNKFINEKRNVLILPYGVRVEVIDFKK